MAQFKTEHDLGGNSFAWGMPPALTNPMMATLADVNGTVLEGFATAHKEWAEFAQRRIREDVAVSRQLLSCRSLADMHQIYAQYLHTAFEQYREHSEKIVQRSARIAHHLAETTEDRAKEAAQARH